VAMVLAASLLQAAFGLCRAIGGVVAQSTLMSIVPRHFMGRTQSAMAIVTTAVQLAMCVALGWIAEKAGIMAAYTLLALLYAGGTLTAFRARQLLRAAS
jgi:ABC-type maltose transport system permease subunit